MKTQDIEVGGVWRERYLFVELLKKQLLQPATLSAQSVQKRGLHVLDDLRTLPQTSQVGAKAHIDLLMLEDAFRQNYVVVHNHRQCL